MIHPGLAAAMQVGIQVPGHGVVGLRQEGERLYLDIILEGDKRETVAEVLTGREIRAAALWGYAVVGAVASLKWPWYRRWWWRLFGKRRFPTLPHRQVKPRE